MLLLLISKARRMRRGGRSCDATLPTPPGVRILLKRPSGYFMLSINSSSSHSRHGAAWRSEDSHPACFGLVFFLSSLASSRLGRCAIAHPVASRMDEGDEDCRRTEPQQAGDTAS
ncbi:hypothetical protein BBK36DRAFT_126157 [Trichoderma citrinoviride]|uniref:Uncharacterized protein n=1 Tax=Trichoderma citrinoviride TaxID=58853 RepID=A0A2T4BCY1_9HYPO|nr:hypothetical protein BBK36DRAFT_126157 [Trichoderma citrinoviride]PTB67196.1 hypothetical protein BBK36DRAFT_126157 [Trichoderma citrinoviride]